MLVLFKRQLLEPRGAFSGGEPLGEPCGPFCGGEPLGVSFGPWLGEKLPSSTLTEPDALQHGFCQHGFGGPDYAGAHPSGLGWAQERAPVF